MITEHQFDLSPGTRKKYGLFIGKKFKAVVYVVAEHQNDEVTVKTTSGKYSRVRRELIKEIS